MQILLSEVDYCKIPVLVANIAKSTILLFSASFLNQVKEQMGIARLYKA